MAIASTREGTTWRDLTRPRTRVRVVRPKRSEPEEGPRARRLRRDPFAKAMDALHFARGKGHERVDLYVPRAATLIGVAGLFDRFSQRPEAEAYPRGELVCILARLVWKDGHSEWRSCNTAAPFAAALSFAAERMRAWAAGFAPSVQSSIKWLRGERWSIDYKPTRVASVQVLRLSPTEEERRRARERIKAAGKRLRARERYARKRGIRTTRGR